MITKEQLDELERLLNTPSHEPMTADEVAYRNSPESIREGFILEAIPDLIAAARRAHELEAELRHAEKGAIDETSEWSWTKAKEENLSALEKTARPGGLLRQAIKHFRDGLAEIERLQQCVAELEEGGERAPALAKEQS